MEETIGRSLGTDYFRIGDQLTREERDYWRRTRDFVDDEVLPVINGYWERAEFPWPLIEKLAKLPPAFEKDGRVTAFIPDPVPDADKSGTSGAEGVAADAAGNVYGAEVGPRALKKYIKK